MHLQPMNRNHIGLVLAVLLAAGLSACTPQESSLEATDASQKTSAKRSIAISFSAEKPCAITTPGAGSAGDWPSRWRLVSLTLALSVRGA